MRDRATLCLNLLGDGPDASVSDDAQKLLFEDLDVLPGKFRSKSAKICESFLLFITAIKFQIMPVYAKL